MNATTQNPPSPPDQNGPVRVVNVGALRVELLPHYLPGVGAVVAVTVIDTAGSWPRIVDAAGLRKLAQVMQITATEADHKAHNARLLERRPADIEMQQKTNAAPFVERRARP